MRSIRGRAFVAVLAIVVALLGVERIAQACGAAYPGGPMVCTMADAPSAKKAETPGLPRARVFASYAYTSTTILFTGDRRADMTRHAAFAGTEIPVSPRLGLRFGAGGLGGGELRTIRGTATLGPGATTFFGAVATIVDEKPERPFLQMGATLSITRAATRGPAPNEAPSFTAFDLRAALTAGKTIGSFLVPFVTLRAFGGPIFYRIGLDDVRGTDLYKYQVAGGLAVTLPKRILDVFVEGVPLGESGVSAGLGTTFN